MTVDNATNARQPYLQADDDVLQNSDLTMFEKAIIIHRTYNAVSTRCSAMGWSSKVGLGDPERDQWQIDNPNAIAS